MKGDYLKLLIMSDSHGRAEGMRRALALHPDASYLLFLGDGLREAMATAEEFPGVILVPVRGNCDGGLFGLFRSGDAREEELLSVFGRKILLTHGDRYGVKGGLGGLIASARRQNADLVLFGHTHVPHDEYLPDGEKPLRLFNPGSISLPNSGNPTYGILTLSEQDLLLSHGEVGR